MVNNIGFEVEIPVFWKGDVPRIGGIYGIENEKHEIFIKPTLSQVDKEKNALNYKYYDFEEEIDCPKLIKELKEFVSSYDFKKFKIKNKAVILEFTVDFKMNFYFKGFYSEGKNYYDSARYDYDVKNLGKNHKTIYPNIAKYFVTCPKERINYAELLVDVVNKTDNENWAYFSEELSVLAKDFLDYGYFSRVLMMRDYKNNIEIPVGYVQLRVLKNTAPQLLYKDFYHQADLGSTDLWEEHNQLKAGSPIYVDVIAVKQEYQSKLSILKLVPKAIKDIIEEINKITEEPFDIYAVGVTNEGRKMCQMLGMDRLSEIVRMEGKNAHTRTLFSSEYLDFTRRLEKILSKANKR
jgi:hypothetical protein